MLYTMNFSREDITRLGELVLQLEEKIDKLGDRLGKRWKQTGRFVGRCAWKRRDSPSRIASALATVAHYSPLHQGLPLLNTGSIP